MTKGYIKNRGYTLADLTYHCLSIQVPEQDTQELQYKCFLK